MDKSFKKYSILDRFNVSRGTCIDFEKFISLIREKNKEGGYDIKYCAF